MFTLVIICREINQNLIDTIKSVEELQPQILVNIASHNDSFGARKSALIENAAHDWILVLDTDELVSPKLFQSIKQALKAQQNNRGYIISFKNYLFGKHALYGGEKYSHIKLFNKNYGNIKAVPIHEYVAVEGKVSKIDGYIIHNSYRNIGQVISKFSKYAWLMAGEMRERSEKVTLKKLFLYGPHMVWARAIKDDGWRDGWRGIVLALCFGYMEALMYWMLLWRNIFHI